MTEALKKELEAQGESGIRKLRVRMNIATNANMLVNRFKLSEEEFANNVGFPKENYHEFMSGTFDYRVDHATNLDYYTEQLNTKLMKK